MIFLFLACPVVQETPEPSWELPTTDAPLVYWEGLDDPRGLARYGETLWVAEHGGGRILTVENEVMEVVAEDLEGPWMVAASEAGWAFVERDGGRVWAARSGEEASVLAEDLVSPGRITMEGSRVCWVEEGESARVGCGDVDSGEVFWISENLDFPSGLDLAGDTLWVTVAGDTRGVLTVDLATGESQLGEDLLEVPIDVMRQPGGLLVATQSTRWPYGGWIYGGEAEALDPWSHSPPEPEWLSADEDFVYWSSKQSITRVPLGGGSYSLVASQTAVGDLVVAGGWTWWTDTQRGLLLGVEN